MSEARGRRPRPGRSGAPGLVAQTLAAWSCLGVAGQARAEEPAPAAAKVTWADHVAPLFAQACTYCHDAGSPSGGLDLTSYAAALAGGASGAVIAPGDPAGSRLFRLVTGAEQPFMPDDGTELAPEAIATLRAWIAGGALETARITEQLTPLMISVNVRYKAHTGLKLTGLPDVDPWA